MTNQTPESVIDDSVVEAAYRAFCEARIGKALSDDEHDALRSRLELTWIRPTIAAALHVATEAKQPEGWSTEDRQESKQEAERRWVDERSGYKSDYNRGCINGFILGAEWQKARETFISFRSIADEARAERDAALAAIERVRVLHEFDEGYCKSCEIPFHECATATALEAALDGAPEPEGKP